MITVEVRISDKDFGYSCEGCETITKKAFVICVNHPSSGGHYMCSKCLTALRSKIDRLSILVITGIDTDE